MVDQQIEFACRETVTRFLWSLDSREYDALSATFAEDGVWDRHNEELVGPRAVRAAMDKRPADLSTRHLVSNLTVDEEPGGVMLARYLLSAYAQTGPAPARLHNIFVAEDRLRRTPQGWRFVRKSVSPAFSAIA
ncbi:MAG: nuclear transport factor 2 family protein [Rhizomicrobium sp.]